MDETAKCSTIERKIKSTLKGEKKKKSTKLETREPEKQNKKKYIQVLLSSVIIFQEI